MFQTAKGYEANKLHIDPETAYSHLQFLSLDADMKRYQVLQTHAARRFPVVPEADCLILLLHNQTSDWRFCILRVMKHELRRCVEILKPFLELHNNMT